MNTLGRQLEISEKSSWWWRRETGLLGLESDTIFSDKSKVTLQKMREVPNSRSGDILAFKLKFASKTCAYNTSFEESRPLAHCHNTDAFQGVYSNRISFC